MRSTYVILILCVAMLTGVCHAKDNSFQFFKSIPVGELFQEDIPSVILDQDVYVGTQPDYADVRVADQNGQDVPCVIERLTSNEIVKVAITVPSAIDKLEQLDGNRVVINVSVTATNRPTIQVLHIDTPLIDFERRVTVYARTGADQWTPIVTNALLFDYSRFMDVRETSIPLPFGTYRQFRLEIQNVTDETTSPLRELQRTFENDQELQRKDTTTLETRPFRVNQITLMTEEERESVKVDRKVDYAVKKVAVTQDHDAKQTIVHIDTSREPLTELSVKADGQNFSRHAEVQVPVQEGVTKNWKTISSGTISGISFRDFNRAQTSLGFSEYRSAEYRIVIDNRDNPPLQVSGVTAKGNSYRVLFLAQPKHDYKLRYGSTTASLPDYDAAAILDAVRRGYAPREITLGDQIADPSYRSGFGFGFLNGKIFLGLAILIVIITLGMALYRASKGIGGSPDATS